MARHTTVILLGLAVFGATAAHSSRAQTNVGQPTTGLNQNLNDLSSAQLQMERGNAQLQSDEAARQRNLALPEQSPTVPATHSDDQVRENSLADEPLLFEDHKDVRHDTDDLHRNAQSGQ